METGLSAECHGILEEESLAGWYCKTFGGDDSEGLGKECDVVDWKSRKAAHESGIIAAID